MKQKQKKLFMHDIMCNFWTIFPLFLLKIAAAKSPTTAFNQKKKKVINRDNRHNHSGNLM